jgi:hypothetical protein
MEQDLQLVILTGDASTHPFELAERYPDKMAFSEL